MLRDVVNQLSLPVEVRSDEVARKKSLGASIELCIDLAGFDLDKEAIHATDIKIDKAQFSRWKSEQEGIKWKKLKALMDACGNHAPAFWMMHDLGYDIASIRQRETGLERRVRELQEENTALRRAMRAPA